MYKVLLEQVGPKFICTWIAKVCTVLVFQVKLPQRECLIVCTKYGDGRGPHDFKCHLIKPAPSQDLLARKLLLGQRSTFIWLFPACCASLAVINPPAYSQVIVYPEEDQMCPFFPIMHNRRFRYQSAHACHEDHERCTSSSRSHSQSAGVVCPSR